MDPLRLALLALSFGVLCTAHVFLLVCLAVRPPRWHALAALVVPPMAAYWGWQQGRRGATTTWLVGLMGYGISLFFVAR